MNKQKTKSCFIEGRKSRGAGEGKITQHFPPLKGPRIPSRCLMLIWCQGVNPSLKFHPEFVTSDFSTCNYEQWNWLSPTFYQMHPYCALLKKPACSLEQTDSE